MRCSLTLLAAVLLSASPLAAARPHVVARVDLDVVVDGAAQPKVRRGGEYFLPVRRIGSRYALRVTNRTSRRVEAVLSVDGLSVINGRPASPRIRGYLIGVGQSVEIPGWRRGDSHVAAFTFSRERDSYAYQRGRPEGIGVIRLLAFEERTPPDRFPRPHPYRKPLGRAADADRRGVEAASGFAAGGGMAPIRDERIGTGYGRELGHEVSRVPFVRGPAAHRVTIRYGRSRPVPLPRKDNFAPPPPGYDPLAGGPR